MRDVLALTSDWFVRSLGSQSVIRRGRSADFSAFLGASAVNSSGHGLFSYGQIRLRAALLHGGVVARGSFTRLGSFRITFCCFSLRPMGVPASIFYGS